MFKILVVQFIAHEVMAVGCPDHANDIATSLRGHRPLDFSCAHIVTVRAKPELVNGII